MGSGPLLQRPATTTGTEQCDARASCYSYGFNTHELFRRPFMRRAGSHPPNETPVRPVNPKIGKKTASSLSGV